MIESLGRNEGIHYQKLTPEEMKARGILGRLVGVCADFKNPTRNGRKYSEQLWENVFADPIMQEKIKNGVCFGELGHPVERTEIDMEKIAICLREQPKKNNKGQLCAVFDILDTPNGRILKTLCDYGSKLAVSSRGSGDVDDVSNEVDPDTYDCVGWDIVLIPGVESARVTYVTESLGESKTLKLKKALCESLDNATEEERKIMAETLENLDIKLDEAKESDADAKTEIKAQAAEADKLASEAEKAKDKAVEAATKEIEKLEGEKDKIDDKIEDIKQAAGIEDTVTADGTVDPVPVTIVDTPTESTSAEADASTAEPSPTITPVTDSVTEGEACPTCGKCPCECGSVTEDADEETEISTEDTPAEGDAPAADDSVSDEVPADEPIVADDDIVKVETAEGEEIEKTPEEIFWEFAKSHLSEDKYCELCKELGHECPECDTIATDDATIVADPVDDIPTDEGEPSEEEVKVEEDKKPSTVNEDSTPVMEENKVNEEAEQTPTKVEEAVNDGDDELIKSLQEALKIKSDLETRVKSLQEDLAVSNTEVTSLKEECSNYKETASRLSTIAAESKELIKKVSSLEESLKSKDETIEGQKAEIARMVQSRKDEVSEAKTLTESLSAKDKANTELNESLTKKDAEIKSLTEQLEESKNSSLSKINELTESLNKTICVQESYKKLANETINKYIDCRASMLGVTSVEIKNRLSKNYRLADVDKVCEDLKAYQLNISKLPFNLNSKVKIRVNEGVERKLPNSEFEDDDIDNSLINLARQIVGSK